MTEKVCSQKKNLNSIKPYILAFLMLIVISASSMPAEAALNAAGPISTVHGFPTYYQDTTGLALQPCLGVNADGTGLSDPNCVLGAGENPALALAFPNNFPGEFFYYIADADPLTVGPTGSGKAVFRLALEGAFATADGSPAVNQQIAFLRVNLRIPLVAGVLAPDSTYTVTEPFGTFTFTTDASGIPSSGAGQVHRDEDGGLVALDFVSLLPATTTNIGSFLKAATPAPPAGYIGNPAILQTIHAGPNGAFFRIDGKDVGGAGINTVQTNLWTVAGKIAVIDTVPPVIGITSVVTPDGTIISPPKVTVGAGDVLTNVGVTDNLFVGTVTMDIGPVGNDFAATLNGTNALTTSTATGSGAFTINTTANTLSFNISMAGLLGTETAAHIHMPGQAAFTLPLGSPKVGVWNYAEAQEAGILAGNASVHIHTNLFPAGEIAGPILIKSNIQTMFRTAGTTTDGTWSVIIPSPTRVGTFSLPVAASDGSNPVTGNFVLTVEPLLNSVSVTPQTVNVAVGSVQNLSATALNAGGAAIVPQPPIIWSSSNLSVATVSPAGVVTGVSAGTATIAASATLDATTRTNTSTITVVQLTSVGVTPAVVSVLVNGTTQLTATPKDQFGGAFEGATVIWTSSNLSVATVSATGVVTGVSLGTATITANATNGDISVTANSTINVAQLTSVGVTPATASVTVGGTQQLTASPLDQLGTPFVGATVTWNSSNPAVANVNDTTGLVTTLTTGTVTITAIAISGAISVNGTSAITVNPVPPAPPSGGGGGGVTSSSGGGGSAGGAQAPAPTKTITRTMAGKVSKVEVNLKAPAAGPAIIVAEVPSVPVDAPQDMVYQYINITLKNFGETDIENATFEFSVEKSWIAANNISGIYLAKYENGWKKFRTELISSSGDSNKYVSFPATFSYFAIVGEKAAAKPQAPPVGLPENASATQPPKDEASAGGPTGLFLGVSAAGWIRIIVGIVALAGLGYYFARNGKRLAFKKE